MDYWMNVDRPTRTCTLHKLDCSYVIDGPSSFKSFGSADGDDGGWNAYKTIQEAEDDHKALYAHMMFKKCSRCL